MDARIACICIGCITGTACATQDSPVKTLGMSTEALEKGVELAVAAAGSQSELARRLNVKVQSIQQWKRVPEDRVAEVEPVTGVPREKLRPDLAALFGGNRRRRGQEAPA